MTSVQDAHLAELENVVVNVDKHTVESPVNTPSEQASMAFDLEKWRSLADKVKGIADALKAVAQVRPLMCFMHYHFLMTGSCIRTHR